MHSRHVLEKSWHMRRICLSLWWTGLQEIYDGVRKRVPRMRQGELPKIPDSTGSSTDPDVVEERKQWIMEFFTTAFDMLDDAMQHRDATRQSNDWETKFARDTYAVTVDLLAAATSILLYPNWTWQAANTNEVYGLCTICQAAPQGG